ncbi:MAG: PAS domain S-box protein [Bacteroidales bacterium]|nr:PAS domain S-box protein [Bacteroidales bacterium]
MAIDGICITSFDGYFLNVNTAMEKLLGYNKGELLASPIYDFVHPDDLAKTRSLMENHISKGYPAIKFENRIIHQSGRPVWISWSVKPVMEEKIMFGLARDVSQEIETANLLRRAKEESEEKEKLYKTVFETTNEGILIYSSGETLEFANPAACRIHGYTKYEMVKLSPSQYINPEDQYTLHDIFELIMTGNTYLGRAKE